MSEDKFTYVGLDQMLRESEAQHALMDFLNKLGIKSAHYSMGISSINSGTARAIMNFGKPDMMVISPKHYATLNNSTQNEPIASEGAPFKSRGERGNDE